MRTVPAFLELLRRHTIRISMDGSGAWRDNVFVERPDHVYFNSLPLAAAA